MCCWSNFWSPLISDQFRQSPTIGPYFPIGPILNLLQMIFDYFNSFLATSNLFIYYEKARGVHMFLRKDEIFVILRDICPKIPRPQFLFWGQKRVFCDICWYATRVCKMLDIATVGRDKSHVWKKNTFFCRGNEKQKRKRRKIFGERKYFMQRRRRKEEEIYWKRKDCCGQDGTDIKGSMRGSRGPKKSQHFYCLTHFKISHVKETE